MDAHHDAADLASWLRGARGQLTASGGRGARYAAGDVDAFLSGLAAELDRGVVPDPERMRTARFRVTRLRSGYPEREVDELMRGLERRLGEASGTGVPVSTGTEPVLARIRDAQFRTTRRDGYDEREVDDFLDDVVEAPRPAGRPSLAVHHRPAATWLQQAGRRCPGRRDLARPGRGLAPATVGGAAVFAGTVTALGNDTVVPRDVPTHQAAPRRRIGPANAELIVLYAPTEERLASPRRAERRILCGAPRSRRHRP